MHTGVEGKKSETRRCKHCNREFETFVGSPREYCSNCGLGVAFGTITNVGKPKVASFTYFGETPDKDRIVRFYQDPNTGKWAVDIEGLPQLARTSISPEKAREYFMSIHDKSWKDHGASEIDWGSL